MDYGRSKLFAFSILMARQTEKDNSLRPLFADEYQSPEVLIGYLTAAFPSYYLKLCL